MLLNPFCDKTLQMYLNKFYNCSTIATENEKMSWIPTAYKSRRNRLALIKRPSPYPEVMSFVPRVVRPACFLASPFADFPLAARIRPISACVNFIQI